MHARLAPLRALGTGNVATYTDSVAPPANDMSTEYDPEKIRRLHDDVHAAVPSEPALRVKALESLLVAKGMLDSSTVDTWVDLYANEIGPRIGANIVARAWRDADFRQRLLDDGTTAIQELGYGGRTVNALKVVANSPDVHNLVVCTLCSCYPFSILGVQPAWYKLAAYRSRAVRDPRGVLAEFGENLPADVRVDVWDSTAELRYLVLPEPPANSEHLDEEALAACVTRNSMIGTQRTLAAPG